MPLFFEWDPVKARNNIEKHGITFDEASTSFEDPLSLTIADPLHFVEEVRFVLIGQSHRGKLLIVIHTVRSNRIRIISARKATRKECRHYEENEE